MIDTTQFTKLLIFKRHWQLAVTLSLTIIAVVVPVALGMPNLYSASTKLTVERRLGATSTQAVIESLDTRMLKIKQEALSRRNVSDLIERLNLYPALRRKVSIETVINRVQNDLTVTPQLIPITNGMPSMLSFTLSYVGDDPAMVANVANTLASFYVEQNGTLRMGQVSRVVQQLKDQVDEAQRQLDAATARTTAYLTKNADRLPEQNVRKNAQLSQVAQDLGLKTGRQTNLKERRNRLILDIAVERNRPAPGATASTPEQLLAQATRELEAFGPGATDLVPGVAQLKARIAALDKAVKERSSSPVTDNTTTLLGSLQKALEDTDTELTALDAEVESLERRRAALAAEIERLPSRFPELDNLNSDARAARESYDGLRRLYEQAVLAERTERAQDGEEFRVFEPARVPTIPSAPNRIFLILAGVIFAVVAGLGAAVARDLLDTSFHTLDDLRAFTEVPVLATIPNITTTSQKARRIASTVALAGVLVVGLAFVSVNVYRYAQQHVGITRLLSRPN